MALPLNLLSVPLISLLCFVCACSSSGRPSLPRLEFERISAEEQMIEALDHAPNQFQVGFDDDALAWERTRLFFGKYTSKPVITELDKAGDSLRISNSASEAYRYEVRRLLRGDSFEYNVSCQANPVFKNANSFFASRNSRNLARFIRDGQLELTLLAH